MEFLGGAGDDEFGMCARRHMDLHGQTRQFTFVVIRTSGFELYCTVGLLTRAGYYLCGVQAKDTRVRCTVQCVMNDTNIDSTSPSQCKAI